MANERICGGYILLSRKLIDSQIMKKPPLYLKVWIWLLLKAQHGDYKGLKRGQYKTSLPEIIEAMSYKVGYRIERPSKKEIFGIIEWLRNPHEGNHEGNMMVTTKVTQGFVYNIVNYDVYQNPNNYEGNNENPAKVLRREEKGSNNNKNVKNDKNLKEYSSEIIQMADKLKFLILQNNPGAKTPTDMTKWQTEFDKMKRLDKRTDEQIFAVMEFSQKDPFWKANILSAGKLREKFDTLLLQKDRPKPQQKTGPAQKGNFNQRKYTDEDFEKLYKV